MLDRTIEAGLWASASLVPCRPVTHAIENPNRVFHKTAAGVMSDEVNQDEVIEITAPGHPPITYLRFAPRDAR